MVEKLLNWANIYVEDEGKQWELGFSLFEGIYKPRKRKG